MPSIRLLRDPPCAINPLHAIDPPRAMDPPCAINSPLLRSASCHESSTSCHRLPMSCRIASVTHVTLSPTSRRVASLTRVASHTHAASHRSPMSRRIAHPRRIASLIHVAPHRIAHPRCVASLTHVASLILSSNIGDVLFYGLPFLSLCPPCLTPLTTFLTLCPPHPSLLTIPLSVPATSLTADHSSGGTGTGANTTGGAKRCGACQ